MKIDPHKTFATRECPSCACDVASNHNRCPICSYEFPTANSPIHRHTSKIALVLLLLLLAGILRGFLR